VEAAGRVAAPVAPEAEEEAGVVMEEAGTPLISAQAARRLELVAGLAAE
jgi:hypothetical protein